MKTQGKSADRQLIENQPLGLWPARIGALCPALGKATPPFAAHGTDGERDPRGGIAAQISLPLCVTPCSPFGASEGRA